MITYQDWDDTDLTYRKANGGPWLLLAHELARYETLVVLKRLGIPCDNPEPVREFCIELKDSLVSGDTK